MIQTASSKPKPLALPGGLRVRRERRTCLFRGLLTPNTHTHESCRWFYYIYILYMREERCWLYLDDDKDTEEKKRTCDVLMNLLYCNSSQLSGIKGLCNMCLPLVPLHFFVSCLRWAWEISLWPSRGSVRGLYIFALVTQ